MAEKLDLTDIVTLEELPPSNMWGIASLVEVLESKGKFRKPNAWPGRGSRRERDRLGEFVPEELRGFQEET